MSNSRQAASPRELLVPYIAWLRERCPGMNSPQTSGEETRISFGQRTLNLDPWAIERLQETLGEGSNPAEHCVLLTEIVALLLRCMADSERFAAASTGKVSEYYRLQAELMLDSNLGNSLVARAQREVDSLVQRGLTEDARQLSSVAHKLRRSLVEVNRNAGTKIETPVVESPVRAVEWVTDSTEDDDTDEVDRLDPTTLDDEAIVPPEPTGAGPDRTRFLAAVLALALGLWFVAIELPKWFGSHPRQLKISDLHAPTVELSIQSRWPGLYVEVRSDAWSSLDVEQQKQLVNDLVESASQREFTSVLVRTVDGRSLAQWWSGREIRWSGAGAPTPDAIATGLPAS